MRFLGKRLLLRNTFGRQAIPMVWDYAEANPFSKASGGFENMLEWVEKSVRELPSGIMGQVIQHSASAHNDLRQVMVSTDPPYYDNIGYADLSDFFYIWLRRSLKNIYPENFSTMLVPKAEELVATPHRFDGSRQAAKEFFERGMADVCRNIYQYAVQDMPLTIYYAFKQTDMDVDGVASSGWETMLSAIIKAGFSITGTWPMRTEMSNRQVAMGTNSLASSIVLVCRKRPADAPICTRRDFLTTLGLQGLTLKLNSVGSPNLRISRFSVSSTPSGTSGLGVLGTLSSALCSSSSTLLTSASRVLILELSSFISANSAEVSSPALLSLGTSREAVFCLFLSCSTSARSSLLLVSSFSTLSMPKSPLPRLSTAALTLSKFSLTLLTSSIS